MGSIKQQHMRLSLRSAITTFPLASMVGRVPLTVIHPSICLTSPQTMTAPALLQAPYLDQCHSALTNSNSVAATMTACIQNIEDACTRFSEIWADLSQDQVQASVGAMLREAKLGFDHAAFGQEIASLTDPTSSALFLPIGQHRADFANLCLDLALLEAWHWAKKRHLLTATAPDTPAGLFILGLGKLGGRDLNFSSDVDVIAFYDKDTFPVHHNAGRSEAAGKILARMGRTLSDPLLPQANGRFVWRVDWRLRPDPSVNPLALSVSAGLDYYFSHAAAWERLALAKARVAAGDRAIGQNFIKELSPFIWRRNLAFDTLDDIAALKQTIHARHPGLASERERHWWDRGDTLSDWADFNLKLGVGGIREIEFITQALQMLWGGRDTSLRTTTCLLAIEALTSASILNGDDARALEQAYIFLRRSENAVQAYQNSQVHRLPKGPESQAFLISATGFQNDPASYINALKQHTHSVAQLFDALLVERHARTSTQDQNANQGSVPIGFDTQLGEAGQKQWRQLERGNIPAAQSPAGRQWLQKLLPWIASVSNQSSKPDETLSKIFTFLARQPLSASYLESIVRFPQVQDVLAKTFTLAPNILTLVQQSPFMIDRLVAGDPGNLRTLFDSQQDTARDEEIWLNRLRRLVNEELFATYAGVMTGALKPVDAEAYLTMLAEEAVRAQLRFVANRRELPVQSILNNVNIIAMGKLGMGRMAPLSDLDLIVVNSNPDTLPDLRAFMSRFITGMTAKMSEGIAYDLDLRLRPNGRSGPPAISLASFENHHQKSAKTWEHLALTAGRVLTIGEDNQAALSLEASRRSILCTPREREQARLDAARMLVRLRKHRIRDNAASGSEVLIQNRFNIKLRPGGLMETEFLIATLTLLQATTLGTSLFDCEHDARPTQLGVPSLATSLRFWRNAQWYSRLMDLGPSQTASSAQSALFCERMGLTSLKAFDELADQHAQSILKALTDLLPEALQTNDSEPWQAYRETTVQWLAQD